MGPETASTASVSIEFDPEVVAGRAKLEELGLGHLSDVHVSFGGICTGGLAKMLGVEPHQEVTNEWLASARAVLDNPDGMEAAQVTKAAEAALVGPLVAASFVKRDQQTGDYLRNPLAAANSAPRTDSREGLEESKKKF